MYTVHFCCILTCVEFRTEYTHTETSDRHSLQGYICIRLSYYNRSCESKCT